MLHGISLIVLGVLAAPSILLSRKPNAKELLDKIAPVQGWLGIIFCFWGMWVAISALLNTEVLNYAPVWWITWIAGGVLETILGFILGYGIINELILSNHKDAEKKGGELLAKLTPIQHNLGLAGIALGVWMIIASLIHYT